MTAPTTKTPTVTNVVWTARGEQEAPSWRLLLALLFGAGESDRGGGGDRDR